MRDSSTQANRLGAAAGVRLRADAMSRTCGALAMLGVATVAVIWLVAQFLRTDVNWVTVTMSIYVLGPYGSWVRAGFLVAAPALASLGIGLHHTLRRQAPSSVALALFVIAAVALCFTGAFVTDTTPSPVTLHGAIHQWAAFATFEAVTMGMSLQSWMFRIDPQWRRHFPDAFTLAVITTIYFWVYALFHPIPRGVGEKVMIGLVLLWVWRAGWWLVRNNATDIGL